MHSPRITPGPVAVTLVAVLCGCATNPARLTQQLGESFVLVGEEPAALAHLPARGQPLRLRSTYARGSATIDYGEGRDFVVDRAAGTVRRTPDSRIPDFRTNVLYGRQEFDHTKSPGFGNNGFFAFADYALAKPGRWPVQPRQTELLKKTQTKLLTGQAVKLVAFGDRALCALGL